MSEGRDPGHAFMPGYCNRRAGLKVAIKDVFDERGKITSAGSAALAESAPAHSDADVVTRLLNAHCTIVGRTNMHELAYGVTGINAWTGTPLNPNYPSLIPGGSSSGGAAAIAAGLADISIGTDTGGSIRIPATCCGVIGLKPSFGRVSRRGATPPASSLDCAGPMASTVALIERAMAILVPGWARAPAPCRPRVGFVATRSEPRIAHLVRQRAETAFNCIDVELSDFPQAMAAGLAIIGRENWSAFSPLLSTGLLGSDVQSRLEAAALITDDDIAEAEKVRRRFTGQVDALLADLDALALPVMPCLPLTLVEAEDAQAAIPITANCRPFNLSGHPAIAVPVGEIDARPVAMQLVARRGHDEALCALARLITGPSRTN